MTFVIDDEVKEKLEAIDDISVDQVTTGINLFLTARALKTKTDAKIAEIIQEAEDILLPILAISELERMTFPGAGRLDYDDDPKSKKFDKPLLQTTLLESGVSAAVIAKAMKAANVVSDAKEPYKITFTKEKAAKKKT
jgi:hypothetical protein